MNKIETFLVNHTKLVKAATSTVSTYFQYKSLKIRYSDHISQSDADIQIIYSSFLESPYYAVLYKDKTKLMLAKATKVIELLDTLDLTNKLEIHESDSEFSTLNRLANFKNFTLKMSNSPKINNIIIKSASYWTTEELNNLSSVLSFEFGICRGVTGNFRNWLKCTKVSGIEFLKIYKSIIIEGKKKFDADKANKLLNELRRDNTTSQMC